MIEWIVTSSALIGIVIGLRSLTKGRIPMGLRYGLWVLVLVRLLLPVSIPSSFSIMNLLPEPAVSEPPVSQTEQLPQQQPSYTVPKPIPSLPAVRPQPAIKPQVQPNTQEKVSSATPISLEQVLLGIWIAGMVVTGCVLLFTNIHFAMRLKRSRTSLSIPGCKVEVYQSRVLSTPCVHGLLFPKIYLTTETMDAEQRQHILLHEMTHLRHGDPLWSLLRCVCLVLHWYNPLVWIAAVLSRQDAELACDEAVVRRLGEEQRSAYGQTLIRMSCTRNRGTDLLLTASTMHTTKKLLKERISMIAKKPRNTVLALLLFVLVAAIAVGCTMTGSKQDGKSDNDPDFSQAITFVEDKAVYIRQVGGFGGDFTITLYKDGRFKYYEGNLSSYLGYGNWTLADGILTLNDDNQNLKFSNRFRVEQDKLIWLAADSTGFTYGSYLSMADEDVFFRQSPKPAELSYMTDLAYLPQDYMDGGPLGCFLFVDGTTYVWDHHVTSTLQDMQTEEIGAVVSCDNTKIPETHLSACRVPVGTVLYKGKDAGKSKYEAIYYKLEGFELYARLLPADAYRGAERWWESQTMHEGSQGLTVDALRKLQEEKGKLLTRSDLNQYGYVAFSGDGNLREYRLFQVDTDYRLLLVSATTVADIEALQARFYHKDIPNYWIDLITTDIDLYQSNLTSNEIGNVTKTEVVYEANGFVTAESLKSGAPCMISLEKTHQADLHLSTQLVINSSTGTLREVISSPQMVLLPDGETLYLADLDGDSDSEIILQEDLGGCGGYGAYRCRVFQVDNNGISEMFDSEPEAEIDTGFYWEISKPFTFMVYNRFTGAAWKLETCQERLEYYFDNAGKITVDSNNYPLEIDSFYEFYPKDVDADGIYELCTTQYTFDRAHVDGVGDAKCIFKYDNASGSFRIVETDFVAYTE